MESEIKKINPNFMVEWDFEYEYSSSIYERSQTMQRKEYKMFETLEEVINFIEENLTLKNITSKENRFLCGSGRMINPQIFELKKLEPKLSFT